MAAMTAAKPQRAINLASQKSTVIFMLSVFSAKW